MAVVTSLDDTLSLVGLTPQCAFKRTQEMLDFQ